MKTSLLVVAAMAALGSADLILHPAKRSIAARGLSSWGGFALQANPCPSGTSTCQTDSCCPDGYTCNSKSNTPMCCPSSADCSVTVNALPACADNSWDLYTFAQFFCCAPDMVGTWTGASGIQCFSRDLPIPESISLTMVSQVTGTGVGAGAVGATGSITSAKTTPGGSQATGTGGSGSGSGSGTSSSDSRTGSSSHGLSQAATIAIAVLATAVGMLLIFIIWRCCKRQSKPQGHMPQVQEHRPQPQTQAQTQQYYPVSPNPPPSERAEGTHSIPPPYRSPPPQAREVSGATAFHTGPVHETEAVHRIELEGNVRK
ncbi:hypothetical protein QBC33DRAFT_542847 [Phialemonium atrogriseum]|uniref:Extracellular membrane protein CFEM domain-containing protein n=1 Tax=Phialemonium atrogriseum TaxID=1093897 RepID=A0AAJ0BWS6_9PEZI|nr:uncharacterized protein QBC33DRAFT_542847 [Phialemonium atrogriseum]KAK1765905.1 hypothetical protein QBC33DRAFT_542847 [Phialemonium atrogriseum]